MDYGEFRKQYEVQHPASVPTKMSARSEYPNWLSPLALLMFLAVSLVSGVHTVSTMRYTMIASMVIPEGVKDYIALAAFFGFEIALFVSVFSWIRQNRRWLSYAATGVVFVVILLANVRDIERAADNGIMDVVMVFGIGIGTPLVALMSGKLFVDIYHSKRGAEWRSEEQYSEALKQWDAIINREHAKFMKSQASRSAVPAVSLSGQNQDSGVGDRTSQRDRVREYLKRNPDAMSLSVRTLADKLAVSKSTADAVKQEFSSNGNGHVQ